jgi:O-antigen biosynthesis protein WbqP
MPKFRSMRIDTPELATDQLAHPNQWVTRIGRILRRTSADELPQLWSVLRGDMSLVGPRPALVSQLKLNRARRDVGIEALRPGITGWAQVNGRDEMPDERKLELDTYYLQNHSVWLDLRILALTAMKVVTREGVAH